MEVGDINLFENEATISLTYTYEGQYSYYPFPFQLEVIYTISRSTFNFTCTIENTGQLGLPYGFGWHPYFKFNGKVNLSMPSAYHQPIDRRMLPLGDETIVERFQAYQELDEHLDDSFRFVDKGSNLIKLANNNSHQLEFRLDESIRFVQLYTPESNIIAVEPITCGINAFNSKKGLLTLDAGKKRAHKCDISIL